MRVAPTALALSVAVLACGAALFWGSMGPSGLEPAASGAPPGAHPGASPGEPGASPLEPIPAEAGTDEPAPAQRVNAGSESSADQGAGTVRVRVVAQAGGAPIPGARVIVKGAEDELLGRGEADATGLCAVRLAFVPKQGLWILARPPRDQPLEPASTRVAAAAAFEGEITVRCPVTPLAHIHGRVVEASLGTPLAGVRIELTARFASETVETDADGYFQTSKKFPSFRFNPPMVGPDGRRLEYTPRPVEHDASAPGDLELRAHLGPRLRLRVSGPPQPDAHEWKARIVERKGLDGEVLREWPTAPARDDGAGLVVQWRRHWGSNDPERTALLAVEDSEGTWSGSTLLAWPLAAEQDVTVQVSALAAVKGTVVDQDGRELEDVVVGLAPRTSGAAPRDPEGWKSATTDGEGQFAIRGLQLGSYHLRLKPPYGESTLETIELSGGERDLGRLVAAQRSVAGSIAGTITSRGNTQVLNVVVVLESIDGGDVLRTLWTNTPNRPLSRIPVVGRRFGQDATSRFDFADVPVGRYRVTPTSLDGYTLLPAHVETSAPAEDLAFVLADDVDKLELVVRATDAQNGEPIESLHIAFRGPRWRFPDSRTVRSGETVGRVPRDAPLGWTISADGYCPTLGDLTAAHEDGDQLVLEVSLEPGWGLELLVLDGRTRDDTEGDSPDRLLRPMYTPPVAGAHVFADGELAGTSDADGIVLLARPSKPARLEVVHTGWKLAPGSAFEASKLSTSTLHTVVWLVPGP
ncbi:MAG: hypothetical protein GY711_17015 [bacterium]|nr:hypothetical protein [bacterium]